jgi:type I restriction enzyme, R subunit
MAAVLTTLGKSGLSPYTLELSPEEFERRQGWEARTSLNRRDQEACVALLRDEKVRNEFQEALKQFLTSLDTVLPRPEALAYVSDAKLLSLIQAKARNRYRTGLPLIGREVGEKVRTLIDDHIVSNGIDPTIPPVAITDAQFGEHVEGEVSSRAKARRP